MKLRFIRELECQGGEVLAINPHTEEVLAKSNLNDNTGVFSIQSLFIKESKT